MSTKVFVFKSNEGFKVNPATTWVSGGNNIEVVNATTQGLIVHLPIGAGDASAEVEHPVAAGKKRTIPTVSQGPDTTRAYEYRVRMESGLNAQGNSDPVLIIEN